MLDMDRYFILIEAYKKNVLYRKYFGFIENIEFKEEIVICL